MAKTDGTTGNEGEQGIEGSGGTGATGVTAGTDAAEAVRRAFVDLAAIAQTGLNYAQDPFDRQRYAQVGDVAERLRALVTAGPLGELARLVDPEGGHATPKVDTRGAVFDPEGRLLMTRERSDGLWTLPGGWCDVLEPPTSNVIREIREEAGVEARMVRLAAVLDREVRGHQPPMPVHAYKLFFICEEVSRGGPLDEKEILEVGWFDPQDLPPLSTARILPDEIAICVEAWRDPSRPTVVD
ncbi:NUDIX hydrolase [Motilibacter aurantiacus]|uniref:NUDIX hydrolase n=1 Tax=Motilibacter aurantiacus TaxID=2714955 RepID=UPI00140A6828|nr:NUDIX hydrolase N-terminal domain-containing protein [Motilibacter aurantiacus]NHC44211.1 NUDIX hydrolase [Motilibacter aurantiacus]